MRCVPFETYARTQNAQAVFRCVPLSARVKRVGECALGVCILLHAAIGSKRCVRFRICHCADDNVRRANVRKVKRDWRVDVFLLAGGGTTQQQQHARTQIKRLCLCLHNCAVIIIIRCVGSSVVTRVRFFDAHVRRALVRVRAFLFL